MTLRPAEQTHQGFAFVKRKMRAADGDGVDAIAQLAQSTGGGGQREHAGRDRDCLLWLCPIHASLRSALPG